MNSPFLHPLFSIRGKSYNRQSLTVYAKELLLSNELYEQSIGSFFIKWLSNDTHITVTSSGTTKSPKQVLFKKEALAIHSKMSASYFNLKPKDTIALVLSGEFIASKMILVRAMIIGLDLWFYKPTKAPLASINKVFDWCSMVPLQLLNSLEELYKVKKILVGGAPMTAALQKQAVLKAQQQGSELYVSFGMTETLSHIAIAALFSEAPLIYKILPGIKISKNKQDCLAIEASYLENKIETSDKVALISKDTFHWLGRADNTVNSGGIKLQPELIEQEMSRLFNFPFFLAGIADEILGQKLCLVIKETEVEKALKALKEVNFSHPFYKPKSILLVPHFSYTISEKLKRQETLQSGFKEVPLQS